MKLDKYKQLKTKMKSQDYVLYARKSSESEDKQVASVDSQLNALQDVIASKNLCVVETFTENKSAKKPGRPEFNRMIETLKEKETKGIVCWKPNRLFRNPQDEGMVRQLLYEGTIQEIVTPNKTYTADDSDFILAVEGSQAQRFIKDLREDTKRGMQAKIDKGLAPMLAPAGYVNDKHMNQGEKTISPSPLYFDLVREIFELAMTGNFSTEALAVKAQEIGIRSARGKLLSRTQMYKMLRNPFYTGRFVYSGVLHQGVHKPMLTDDEFNLVQERIAERHKSRDNSHDFSLSGFIKCKCGYQLSGETHTKKSGKTYTYYRCTQHGKKGCSQPMVSAPQLEEQVFDFLGQIKLKKSFIDYANKWVRKMEEQDKTVRVKALESVQREYDRVAFTLDNLTETFLSPKNQDKSFVTDEEYKKLKQKYIIMKDKLASKLRDDNKAHDGWIDFMVDVLNFSSNAQALWKTGDIDTKKMVMSIIGAKIIYENRKLQITPDTLFSNISKLRPNSSIVPKLGVESKKMSLVGE